MGIIKDIVDKVAPIAQERIEKEGIDIKQAIEEELIKLNYLKDGDSSAKRNKAKEIWIFTCI